MRIFGLGSLALAVAVMAATPALSRRTVIDNNGPRTLQGYCDFNGDDCAPQQLGFSVDFGNGPTNAFIIYGNGLISFGSAAVDYSQSANYSPGDTLAKFGGNVISAGLFNYTEQDFYGSNDDVFATSATVVSNTANGLSILFEYCENIGGTTTCDAQAQVDISRANNGLDVSLTHHGRPSGYYGPNFFGNGFFNGGSPGTVAAGYSINGSTQMFDSPSCSFGGCVTGGSFTIPASITSPPSGAVPEPSSWALIIIGFGALGAGIRRKFNKAGWARLSA